MYSWGSFGFGSVQPQTRTPRLTVRCEYPGSSMEVVQWLGAAALMDPKVWRGIDLPTHSVHCNASDAVDTEIETTVRAGISWPSGFA